MPDIDSFVRQAVDVLWETFRTDERFLLTKDWRDESCQARLFNIGGDLTFEDEPRLSVEFAMQSTLPELGIRNMANAVGKSPKARQFGCDFSHPFPWAHGDPPRFHKHRKIHRQA